MTVKSFILLIESSLSSAGTVVSTGVVVSEAVAAVVSSVVSVVSETAGSSEIFDGILVPPEVFWPFRISIALSGRLCRLSLRLRGF